MMKFVCAAVCTNSSNVLRRCIDTFLTIRFDLQCTMQLHCNNGNANTIQYIMWTHKWVHKLFIFLPFWHMHDSVFLFHSWPNNKIINRLNINNNEHAPNRNRKSVRPSRFASYSLFRIDSDIEYRSCHNLCRHHCEICAKKLSHPSDDQIGFTSFCP